VFWLAASALAAGAALLVFRSKKRHAAHPASPPPDELAGRGLAALGIVLVLCLTAAIGAPMLLRAQAAAGRERWAAAITGGDPARAPVLMVRNGCAGCHVIAGVPGAQGRTGPELAGMGRQKFIAGLLPNTPENLAAWIRDARRYDAHTAMPSTLISKAQSRDIAAYLYTIGR
jgi:cytochrome c1